MMICPTGAVISTPELPCGPCWTLGVVPVINENDTVVTDEIRFGDNDTLAALVANLLEADVLVILTDQAGGLHEQDPRNCIRRRLW